jgi:hypothetical protein
VAGSTGITGGVRNRKATLLNGKQAAIILVAVKQANNNQHDLARSLQGTETALTPVLKTIRRIAGAGGLIKTDRDGIGDTYRGGR